jgi:hypothetical protein
MCVQTLKDPLEEALKLGYNYTRGEATKKSKHSNWVFKWSLSVGGSKAREREQSQKRRKSLKSNCVCLLMLCS